MTDSRFRRLLLCFMTIWTVALGQTGSYSVVRDHEGNEEFITVNKTGNISCVSAQPIPKSQAYCKPYRYKGSSGVCASIVKDRNVYGSSSHQRKMESSLYNFRMAKAYILSKGDISDRCLRTVDLVYCNHYFPKCDDTSSKILPVPVCREACDVMVQRHCKEEYRRAKEINKALQDSPALGLGWSFELLNCSEFPLRNGGSIPECHYPEELEEKNALEGDFSDRCFYGDGQLYRGNVSVTQSGYKCQSWTSQCPHRHHRTPEIFPELSNTGNACRNPGGQAPLGPWCYTTNSTIRWEYCNISTCAPEDATLSNWSPFTNCSVSCGNGWITRTRTCTRPRLGGKNCSSLGALVERQPCSLQNCSENVDNIEEVPVDKKTLGLNFTWIIILSTIGSVLFLVSIILVVTLVKKRTGRKPNNPNIQDEEEITPYATVRFNEVFPANATSNYYPIPGMYDNPLKALPPHPWIKTESKAANKQEIRRSPYGNLDHLGRQAVNPLQYLFYQPRYENELTDNTTRDVIYIRPGYDKLMSTTRKKRREIYRGEGTRLACEKADMSVYDSLIREINLKCKSRREDLTDSDEDGERNIRVIMEEPSGDERSPTCSTDEGENTRDSTNLSNNGYKVDLENGCIVNDWNTSEGENEEQNLTLTERNDNLSPRSQAALKMEDKRGLFQFYSASDPSQNTEQEQSAI